MKLAIVIVLLAIVLINTAKGLNDGNGQPDCKTEAELNTPHRNFWDPTAYWKCEKLNEPAVLVRCPTNLGFMPTVKECVPWTDWKWLVPTDNISKK